MITEINQDYKVSKKTAKLVRCYAMANDLYAEVADALEEIYGEMQVDNALEKFSTKFCDAQRELEVLLTDCIMDNLNTLGNDNVL